MKPLSEADRAEVRIAASIPIACRFCGMSDGLVIDMQERRPVRMTGMSGSTPVDGCYIPHTCPRCHRTILLPEETP